MCGRNIIPEMKCHRRGLNAQRIQIKNKAGEREAMALQGDIPFNSHLGVQIDTSHVVINKW